MAQVSGHSSRIRLRRRTTDGVEDADVLVLVRGNDDRKRRMCDDVVDLGSRGAVWTRRGQSAVISRTPGKSRTERLVALEPEHLLARVDVKDFDDRILVRDRYAIRADRRERRGCGARRGLLALAGGDLAVVPAANERLLARSRLGGVPELGCPVRTRAGEERAVADERECPDGVRVPGERREVDRGVKGPVRFVRGGRDLPDVDRRVERGRVDAPLVGRHEDRGHAARVRAVGHYGLRFRQRCRSSAGKVCRN